MTVGELQISKDRKRNSFWRRKFLRDGAVNVAARKALRERCANDILFWVNYFCFTYDPRKKQKVVPFVTYEFQDKAIERIRDDIIAGRDAAIKKSRDMGASWVNIIVPTWLWQFHPMNSFLLVSRNEDYVDAPNDPKSLFWKIDFILKHQPKWMRPKEVKRTSMHIGNGDNGSVIDGESTTGEVGRGDRRTAILLDEFAAFDVKSGYNALAATQSATNCRIFNSTPKGSNNAFYDVVHKSAADIVTMHWSEHPEKARGLYTSKRNESTGLMEAKLLDDWRGVVEVRTKGEAEVKLVHFPEDYPFVLDSKVRSPWYDVQCARAVTPQEIGQELDIDFVGSDYQFFDPIAVEHYKEQYCREPEANVDLIIEPSGCRVTGLSQTPRGRLSLFEMPTRSHDWSADRRFVIGVDVAAGTGASNSTMAIYDRRTNEKVAEYANPNILPDDFGRVVVATARWFNDARIIPDRSGPTGEVLVARIFSEGYTNVYMRRQTKKMGAPTTDEPGVWLNPQLRTTVLQQYRDAIGHCTVLNRSKTAMDECLCFICKMDGNIEHSASANAKDPSGARANHGDMVIADALACLCLGEVADRDVAQSVNIPEGSIAWRMEAVKRSERENSRGELGKEWDI